MIAKSTIKKLAQERIDELDKNLFIVDIFVSSGNQIKVELDKLDGNISIDDCVSVSRNIEHNLDRDKEDFELNVSSAGLDKPFRVKEQYIKNQGEEVKVAFKDQSKKKLTGKLLLVKDEGIVVEETRKERLEGRKKKVTVTEEHEIDFKDIKETKIIISFK